MTKPSPQVALNGSRIVRLLTNIGVTETPLSHANFADRLGRLIDLSNSIALSAVHARQPVAPVEEVSLTYEDAMAEVLRVRTTIVKLIARSFEPSASMIMGLQLPQPKPDAKLDPLGSFEPYQRFYSAHQRDMDVQINCLRDYLREELAGVSSTYTQLTALDRVIDNTIIGHSRRLFAAVPKLLGKRFKELSEEYLAQRSITPENERDSPEDWMKADGWLAIFCEEMQGLLLAELDIRLQPVLGLLEALNKEVNNVHE